MTHISTLSDGRVATVTLLAMFASSACRSYDSIEAAPPVLSRLSVTLAEPVIAAFMGSEINRDRQVSSVDFGGAHEVTTGDIQRSRRS